MSATSDVVPSRLSEDQDRLGYLGKQSKINIQKLFGIDNNDISSDHDKAFFRHYRKCCNLALTSRYSDLMSSRHNADILWTINELKSNRIRVDIVQNLSTFLQEDGQYDLEDANATAECILSLTLRVWLMCNVGSIGGEVNIDQRVLKWEKGTIREFLRDCFPSEGKLKETVRLGRSFKASNLESLGSIQVLWTDNLLDHLRLHDPSDDGKQFRVSIFHHAKFLDYHQDSTVFPPGFIAETKRTLALLLPGYDKVTRRWFRRQRKMNKELDETVCSGEFLDSDQRTVHSFSYWRDRLTILEQAYDESEPRTVLQWWLDSRNSVQWATFWVAVLVLALTVFFGLIQSVEGALQVYKAYHPS